ncbi:early nodulin-like protein 18 [Arachis stenosperma]|uniref:early nodulin-like protein 18 n=1 Tax=Arachis stenosperma TaxID=217475 RepID=UPI0025ACE87E|nr:early nodulin-like protein 18 [Arachis stenosperma]
MEHKRRGTTSSNDVLFSTLILIIIVLCSSGSFVVVDAYKNYTVGDSLGWFDSTMNSEINYQKWASNKVFSLGDFLIFNTDTNHSVVQTYNATTYKQCDYDDAQDKDTNQWLQSNPSNTETHPISVSVPLKKEGVTYFFSSDYDGDQCRSGQRFQINVTHGQGLPKSLKDPSEDSAPSPSGAGGGVSGDDDAAPDTIVPANFNHPKYENSDSSGDDDDNDNKAKGKASSDSVSIYDQIHTKLFASLALLLVVFLWW